MLSVFKSSVLLFLLLKHMQSYPAEGGLSHSIHTRKCWIFAHFNIGIYKTFPRQFPLNRCANTDKAASYDRTQILPQNLNASYLHTVFVSLNYPSFPNISE